MIAAIPRNEAALIQLDAIAIPAPTGDIFLPAAQYVDVSLARLKKPTTMNNTSIAIRMIAGPALKSPSSVVAACAYIVFEHRIVNNMMRMVLCNAFTKSSINRDGVLGGFHEIVFLV